MTWIVTEQEECNRMKWHERKQNILGQNGTQLLRMGREGPELDKIEEIEGNG